MVQRFAPRFERRSCTTSSACEATHGLVEGKEVHDSQARVLAERWRDPSRRRLPDGQEGIARFVRHVLGRSVERPEAFRDGRSWRSERDCGADAVHAIGLLDRQIWLPKFDLAYEVGHFEPRVLFDRAVRSAPRRRLGSRALVVLSGSRTTERARCLPTIDGRARTHRRESIAPYSSPPSHRSTASITARSSSRPPSTKSDEASLLSMK